MNANTVYEVFKALPLEEQKLFYNKLKVHFSANYNFKKGKKQTKISRKDAIDFLINNVFNKRNETN